MWSLILLLALQAQPHNEVEWSAYLAEGLGGPTEVRLFDDSRVDILTETYAIEVDWAKKWPEAIGQSQYYGIITGKEPGVLILTKDAKADRKYLYRCLIVATRLKCKVWAYDTVKGEYIIGK